MKQTTLCFLLKNDQILLAMKKRGFGLGKWNGVGGKVQEGEDVLVAAAREAQEEIGVTIDISDLEAVGTLHFEFKDNPDWAQQCSVFVCRTWSGEPHESEEMRPQWYATNSIPFSAMWIDDPHWFPLMLSGKKFEGAFLFERDGAAMIDFTIKTL